MTITNVSVNDAVVETIRDYSGSAKRLAKQATVTADILAANGITSRHLISPTKPESLATKEFWAELKNAFYMAMTKSEQKIVFADKKLLKGWTKEKKAYRKELQQRPNGQISDLKKALEVREGNAAQGRDPKQPRTTTQLTTDQLTNLIAKFNKLDCVKANMSDDFDCDAFVAALRKARDLLAV